MLTSWDIFWASHGRRCTVLTRPGVYIRKSTLEYGSIKSNYSLYLMNFKIGSYISDHYLDKIAFPSVPSSTFTQRFFDIYSLSISPSFSEIQLITIK